MFPTLMLTAALGLGAEPSTEHVLIEILVVQGDPLGSRAEGTQKYVCQPKLTTMSGRAAYFRSGGEKAVVENGETKTIHIGTGVELLPTVQADGKVKLEMTARNTSFDNGERVMVERRDTRTVEYGTTFKKRLLAEAPDKQLWVEVTISKKDGK